MVFCYSCNLGRTWTETVLSNVCVSQWKEVSMAMTACILNLLALFNSSVQWVTMISYFTVSQGGGLLARVKIAYRQRNTHPSSRWHGKNREIPTLHFFAFLKTNTATYYASHIFYHYTGLLFRKSSCLPAICLYIIVNV